MMNNLYRCLLLSLMITISSCAIADDGGLWMSTTRVVYPEGENGVTLQVNNGSSVTPYLTQVSITNSQQRPIPNVFIAVPPLFGLESKSSNLIRIMAMQNGVTALPHDRESLFYLVIKGIPGGEPMKDSALTHHIGALIRLALTVRMKLFYRPAKLPITPEQAYASLLIYRKANTVILQNSSPYYISLDQLRIGTIDLKIDDDNYLLAPFSQQQWNVHTQGNQATGKVINDVGEKTAFQVLVTEK